MSAFGQREAAHIRRERLRWLLSTTPADRPAAEAAIRELYRLAGLSPPRFRWASSPFTALHTGTPGRVERKPVHSWDMSDCPVLQRLSALCVDVCTADPLDRRLFDQWVSAPMSRAWAQCAQPVLTAAHDGWSTSAGWHRSRGWYWVWADWAAHRGGPDAQAWALWATVARTCGHWWPGRTECVLAERPVALHTEPAGDRDEVRPHRADGPAIRYADGWELYFWHGTRVPEWVITAPTAAAIDAEPNVEVRRCAIERLGWPDYVEQAGMRLVATAPDPGNQAFDLLLYDLRRDRRLLVVTNGSLERDGTRRRYGLGVPGHFTDPVAAAAWTYGLTAAQYSRLAQRT
ncbi:DUF6745 domain-containing protein [Nocardia blacklockiae]|uniref:DUF6745 domain-containing protein n=1 Tax=Nocardia blacklockiae TaxID=480036 RepID=UPI001893130F|nr:hypothetical protein [Nocardia blacklockiae]MBF6175955.1 hypothetical protein [Nocardia blacklockiae]